MQMWRKVSSFLESVNPTYMKRILHFKNITFKSSYNWFKIDIQWVAFRMSAHAFIFPNPHKSDLCALCENVHCRIMLFFFSKSEYLIHTIYDGVCVSNKVNYGLKGLN